MIFIDVGCVLNELFKLSCQRVEIKELIEHMQIQNGKRGLVLDEEIADLKENLSSLEKQIENHVAVSWIKSVNEPAMQAILKMRNIEALTWKEIASVTNLTESAVKSKHRRFVKNTEQ